MKKYLISTALFIASMLNAHADLTHKQRADALKDRIGMLQKKLSSTQKEQKQVESRMKSLKNKQEISRLTSLSAKLSDEIKKIMEDLRVSENSLKPLTHIT